MSFASTSRGQPTNQQRSLYLAAVTFSYAVWENYVESLAVELVTAMSTDLAPDRMPAKARRVVEYSNDAPTSAWELNVHPGWRQLWVDRVGELALGAPGKSKYGLNTATVSNVNDLFAAAGLPSLEKRVIAPEPRTPGNIIPNGVVDRNPVDHSVDLEKTLQSLISIRGEAVHTASTTNQLLKAEVLWWADFVAVLYHDTDKKATKACKALLE